jgi:hypothetical protein
MLRFIGGRVDVSEEAALLLFREKVAEIRSATFHNTVVLKSGFTKTLGPLKRECKFYYYTHTHT